MKTFIVLAAGFLVSAFLVFLVVANGAALEDFGEPGKYVAPAVGFLETGRYVELRDGEAVLETSRLPGFPMVIAASFALFGAENYLAVALVQAGFAALIALGTALTASEIRRNWFLPAGLAAAFWLDIAWRSTTIMPEATFTLLFTWGIYFALAGVRRPRMMLLVLAGVLWGAASLTRPVLLGFAPFAFVGLFFLLTERVNKVRAVALALLPLLVMQAAALPLKARNYELFGAFERTSSTGGHTARWVYPCLVQRFGCGDRDVPALLSITGEIDDRIAQLEDSERDDPFFLSDLRMEIAVNRILNIDPVRLLTSTLGSYAKVMLHTTFVEVPGRFGAETAIFSGGERSPSSALWFGTWVIMQLGLLAAVLLELVGLAVGVRSVTTRRKFLFLLLASLPLILVSVGVGNPRHRAPIEPILIVFFVAGVHAVFGGLRSRLRWRVLAPSD